jgi:hypothetical protein
MRRASCFCSTTIQKYMQAGGLRFRRNVCPPVLERRNRFFARGISSGEGSSSHTGVRIPLAEADARAIKARHDADWKAKAAMKGSPTVPPPSKS